MTFTWNWGIGMAVDPVRTEIIRHRLDSINEEAAITLRQVSGSPVAVEANDLNTAITGADGTVVACGYYVLCQLASMNLVVTDIMCEYGDSPGICEGDQFLTNDPYVGTLHQPDVVVVAPVFYHGRLVAWCGSSVHHFDVGGPTAGGMTFDAASIFDEPTPLPPIRIVAGQRVQRDVERDFLRRSRTPRLGELDLRGQLAANRATIRAVQSLCDKYGPDTVVAVMDGLVRGAAHRRLRERLACLPDGRWRHTCYLEQGPPRPDGSDVYAVRLTVTKRDDQLDLDFRGSSPQAPGAINAAWPALVNFSVAAVMIYLCGDLPWVPGAILQACTITSEEGTVAHARWPAGVAMSTASSCQAIRVCVNACLARMVGAAPGELAGHAIASCCSSGGGGGVFAGARGERGTLRGHDSRRAHGRGRRHQHPGRTEQLRHHHLARCRLRRRGGKRELFAAAVPAAPGAAGFGWPGCRPGRIGLPQRDRAPRRRRSGVGAVVRAGSATPRRGGGRRRGARPPERVCRRGHGGDWPGPAVAAGAFGGPLGLPTRDSHVRPDQAHVAVSQGGGGYGDPWRRDPSAVLADVRDGLVSVGGASADYGVVLRGEGEEAELDRQATAHRRTTEFRRRLGEGATPDRRGPRPVAASAPPWPGPPPAWSARPAVACWPGPGPIPTRR